MPRQLRVMDFRRLLLVFDALLAERHVSRAAAAAGLSQPAMCYARETFGGSFMTRCLPAPQPASSRRPRHWS